MRAASYYAEESVIRLQINQNTQKNCTGFHSGKTDNFKHIANISRPIYLAILQNLMQYSFFFFFNSPYHNHNFS